MSKARWVMLFSVIIMMVILIATLGILANITKEKGEVVNKDKTQIYVGVYNGGLGSVWINEIKTSFESKYPEYQIMPNPGKSQYDSQKLLNDFVSYNEDIFFLDYMPESHLQNFITNKYVKDVRGIIEKDMSAVGESGKTILSKISPAIKDYYDWDGKTYSMPWYQGSYQLIYDVKLFADESLYIDKGGNWNNGSNKSLGQDKIAGTFDDGLPETFDDFFKLADYMLSKKILPLTFFGSNAYYFSAFLINMFADYEGYNDFNLNFNLEGTDSDLGKIDLDNAWQLKAGQSGKRYVLEFAEKLMKNQSYYSSNSFLTSQDNYGAQNDFLMSVEKKHNDSDPKTWRTAMLVDGPWWERESSKMMNDMDKQFPGKGYAYREREFGIMPMPQANDGSSAPGNTVCSTAGRSSIIVNGLKPMSDEVNKGVELFLQYITSNEGLSIATAYSNIMRPYEYTMADEYLDKMTPFGKSVYALNNNADVVFDEISINQFLRKDGSEFSGYLFQIVSKEENTANVAYYFARTENPTIEKYLSGMKIDETLWKTKVEQFRKGG